MCNLFLEKIFTVFNYFNYLLLCKAQKVIKTNKNNNSTIINNNCMKKNYKHITIKIVVYFMYTVSIYILSVTSKFKYLVATQIRIRCITQFE